MVEKLTSAKIKNLIPPDRGTRTLWDAEVKGFGIRIFAPTKRHPHGARSFFLNYRVDGTERRHTIGEFPTWSLEAARAEAKELRRKIDSGEDPAVDKRRRREAPTMDDLRQRYIEDHLPTKSCFGTPREADERRMLDEIVDFLGKRTKINEINHADIENMHRKITQSGRPVRANRIVAIASKAFSLAQKPRMGEQEPWRGALQGNPCRGIRFNSEEGRERFFNDAEISALSDALSSAAAASSVHCIQLIMFTGCRPCEAMKARWQEFDAEPGFWIKPSAHTKQRKRHKVPLNAAARSLIDGLRKNRDVSILWVFPGKNHNEPVKHLRTMWHTVRERASILLWESSTDSAVVELIADLRRDLGHAPRVDQIQAAASLMKINLPASLLTARIYDLRHTFASLGAAGGNGLPVIGGLLGHTQARTTQRYVHLGDDPLRKAAEGIGEALKGSTPT